MFDEVEGNTEGVMDIGDLDLEDSQSSFATPKKESREQISERTSGRRKLAFDDENDIVSEKKSTPRTAGGGLRQFSIIVCKKLEDKKITSYKEVADEIIAEFASMESDGQGPSEEFNEKNIRRRVYDALNVFMALDIIARDKKVIRWKGLPITCKKDLEETKMQLTKLMNSIKEKTACLKELEEKVECLQNLLLRNQQIVKENTAPTEGFTLPFLLVQTSPHATVEVEISEDMQLVHFDFNSTPFMLHDDAYILKMMHEHKLQKDKNFPPQHLSAHSSSSSCVAPEFSKSFSWNPKTNSHITKF